MKEIEDMTDQEFDDFMDEVLTEYRKRYGSSFVDDLNKAESAEQDD